MGSKLNIEVLIAGKDQGAGKLVESVGKGLGNVATIAGGILTAQILTRIGKGFMDIAGFAWNGANELNDAFNTIITGTGASGEALEGLKDDFRAVFRTIPVDAATTASAMTELNTRLGLSGDALQNLSKPLLEATRMMGGDATKNAALFSRVMGDWDVPMADATGALDKFFVAGQATGIGMDDLMGKVVQFGAPMRLMGFSLEDSIALFGKWEKEGVNAELVMGSLRIAAGKFAAEGKPLRDSLLETFDSIKNNTNASEALSEAMSIFGARAGPDMAAAIREGRFEFEDLLEVLGESEGAILDTAQATLTWGEKWDIIKDKAKVALEPAGAMMMDVASTAMDTLAPAIENLTEWMGENLPIAIAVLSDYWTNNLKPAIEVVWNWLKSVLIPFLQNTVKPWLDVHIPKALAFLGQVWETVLLPAIKTVWNWINTTLIPFLQNTVKPWLDQHIPIALAFLGQVWETVLLPAIQSVWGWISGTLIPFFQNTVLPWLEEYIPKALEWLADTWENVLLPAITAVWEFYVEHLAPVLMQIADILENVVGLAVTVLAGFWKNILQPALEDFWRVVKEDVMPLLIKLKNDVIDPITESIGVGLVKALEWVSEKLQIFSEWLKKIKLPDWLTPGSPTPFEWGLRGISDAMSELNRVQLPAFTGRLAVAGAAGGGNIITNNRNINYTAQFGYQSPGDVISDVRLMEMMHG